MDTGNPGDLDALIAAGSAYKNIGRFFGLAKGGGGGGAIGGPAGGAPGPSPATFGPPPKVDIRISGRAQDNSAVVAAIRELGTKLDRLIGISSGESDSLSRVTTARTRKLPLSPFLVKGSQFGQAGAIPWQVRQAAMQHAVVGSPAWMNAAYNATIGSISGGRGGVPGQWVNQWATLQDLRARGLSPSLPLLPGFTSRPPRILEGHGWFAPPPFNAATAAFNPFRVPGSPAAGTGFVGAFGPPAVWSGAGRGMTVWAGGGGGRGGFTMPPGAGGGFPPIPLGRMPMLGAINRGMGLMAGGMGAAAVAGGALLGLTQLIKFGGRVVKAGLPFARFGMHAQGLGITAGVPVGHWLNTVVPGVGQMPPAWKVAGITQQQGISMLQNFPGVPFGPGAEAGLIGIPAALAAGQFFPGLAGMPLGQIARVGTQGVQFGLSPGGGFAAQALHWESIASRFAESATMRGIPRTGFLNTLGSAMGAISAQGAPISGRATASFISPFFSAPGVGIAQANAMSMRAITGQPRAVNRLMGSAFGRYVISLAAAKLSPGAGGGLERTIGKNAYAQLVASNPTFFRNYAATYNATGPSSPVTQAYTASLLRHIQGVSPGAMQKVMQAVAPSIGANAVPGLAPLFLGQATGMGLWGITTRQSFSGFGMAPLSAVESAYGTKGFINARLLSGPYSSSLSDKYAGSLISEGVKPWYTDAVISAAKEAGISPTVFGAFIGQESGGASLVNKKSGAFGPGQIMPPSIADLAQNRKLLMSMGIPEKALPPPRLAHASTADLWAYIHASAADPYKNLEESAAYLRLLSYREHGNIVQMAHDYVGHGKGTNAYAASVAHKFLLGTGLSSAVMANLPPQSLVGYAATVSSYGLGGSRIAFRAGTVILSAAQTITDATTTLANAIEGLQKTLEKTNNDLESLPGALVHYNTVHPAHPLPGVHTPAAPVYRVPR